MDLHATTKAGARLVELGESLAHQLAPGVAERDRAGTYDRRPVDTLLDHGWLSAPVPEELGGGGVGSVHDLLVASSRLARGDAATAIGANMHLVVVVNVVRQWQSPDITEERRAELGAALELLTAGRLVIAAAISEPAQDLAVPSTRAERVPGGWRIDGRKIFCTMSPAADLLLASVAYHDARGEQYGFVQIPAGAPGVAIHDDWDALGMRTSGSCSVSFDGVVVDEAALIGGFPAGSAAGYAGRNLASGAFHASASLGVAEAAHLEALAGLRRRDAQPGTAVDGMAAAMLADNEVDLHAARAALGRAGTVIDRHHEDHHDLRGPDDEVLAVFAEVQAAKSVITAAAARVVDRALLLSGGSGYRAGSALARAVGDVRAAMFMNPLSTGRAAALLADLALGRPVVLR